MADGGELVKATERLLEGRHGRLGAAALRAACVDLYEFWLGKGAAAAGVDTADPGVALAAVGGLGRSELVPFSDLDLLLLHNGNSRVGKIADAIWYPLWDAKIGLDHSVRTPGEALKVASEDLRTAMGLLDIRHIAGDAEITARLAAAARDQWRRTARKRVGELSDAVRQRWARSGEIAQSAEPDLKHGRGGLRDFAVLEAMAAAQLTARPGEELLAAKGLLLDVRTELRRELRRERDILSAPEAETVAGELGFGDRFTLARKLSGVGRTIAYAVDVALRSTVEPPKARFGRRPSRTPLDEGVVLHGNEVALARDAVPAKDPALLLRVAAASARIRKPISLGTLRALAETAPELRAPWPADALKALVEMLGAGEGLIDAVEALDRTGLWARLFPEWGSVRDLPPRSPVHAWTVDRHLVRAAVEASKLTTTVSRPDLLLIGALLHDIGKGRDADHSELGAKISAQVAARLGLPEPDAALVSGMVRHHLLLPHTATRRDISDPATIQRVTKTLDENLVLLELLHALTTADSLATGPGVWTDWKARLLAELVSGCEEALHGKGFVPPEPMGAEQRELVAEAVASGRGEVRITAAGKVVTVVLAVPAPAELLAPAAGVLALNSLEVHAAVLRGHDGGRAGVFTASPKFGSLPDVTLLREQFARAVAGTLPLTQRLAAKERDYGGAETPSAGAKVIWFDDETSGQDTVVVELRAANRIGLLYRVAGALRRCEAEVRWAKVATLGGAVVDSFAVAPRTGRVDQAWRSKIEAALLSAAS
ncbi:[protein-PII] uridylyltransferase [Amycolatopsis regifaucium]|uniref:Bifunctional uridylyltransferase/uridylyl-removing enzyme n=1 Tax=Amycolatopsis regifaucium TaxID=546365 RepID=A0A154M6S8_9PSEU|nr:[protein-PII] uridylyltransferase [Amycolatopsis regifaucium]KZB80328.1 protein-PII uridylyltransferase [Amycolatopsis regifaucium]OKA05297.1 [protein-PII] uridylyltransferase [Amycolatopsis regifaucium]SFJ04412.1 UTP--GlnB (protein PII) uridylyltransferase, GlnD [Amycolatopsis regifaucium]